MKAVPNRTLSRSQITIMTPESAPSLFGHGQVQAGKTVAFIDPPTDTVLMSSTVAKKRGLRGFADENLHLPKGSMLSRDGQSYYERRSRIKHPDRLVAQVSITHDGAYASAVCIIPNEPFWDSARTFVFDDGEGPSIHEPDWDDKDCFLQMSNDD